MIVLDYSLTPKHVTSSASLAEADENALHYDLFAGDITFVVGDNDFSAKWGWVPILDFALCMDEIIDNLKCGHTERFEFTESDATIFLCRDGDIVEVRTSYVSGISLVNYEELAFSVEKFLLRVMNDLTARYPALGDNILIKQYRQRLTNR